MAQMTEQWRVYAEIGERGVFYPCHDEREARNTHALALLDSGAERAEVVAPGEPEPAWVTEKRASRTPEATNG